MADVYIKCDRCGADLKIIRMLDKMTSFGQYIEVIVEPHNCVPSAGNIHGPRFSVGDKVRILRGPVTKEWYCDDIAGLIGIVTVIEKDLVGVKVKREAYTAARSLPTECVELLKSALADETHNHF